MKLFEAKSSSYIKHFYIIVIEPIFAPSPQYAFNYQ